MEPQDAGYECLDDLTQSDLAFRAWGRTRELLFQAAWDALLAVQVRNPEQIRPIVTRRVELTDTDTEMLLHDLLEEQLYLRDTAGVFFRIEAIELVEHGGGPTCTATLAGEPADRDRHELGTEVKAVTMYRFSVRREEELWTATFVVDV